MKRSVYPIGKNKNLESFMTIACIPEIIFTWVVAHLIFLRLGLKPIPIQFIPDWNNCSMTHSKDLKHFQLDFGLLAITDDSQDLDKALFQYIKRTFRSRWEKLFFTVAHEIGHYIQYSKHSKWVERSKSDNLLGYFSRLTLSDKAYRETPIEANADKLAILICKKFCVGLDKR